MQPAGRISDTCLLRKRLDLRSLVRASERRCAVAHQAILGAILASIYWRERCLHFILVILGRPAKRVKHVLCRALGSVTSAVLP